MTENPYLARKARQAIGKAGRKSEKKTSQRLGMKLTSASGAAIAKSDMRDDQWAIEAKSTTAASIALKLEWLIKVAGEASMTGRRPALSVVFSDANGNARASWVMVLEREFRELQSIANLTEES